MIYSTNVMVDKALNINSHTRGYSTFSQIMAVTNEDLVDSYNTIDVSGKILLVPASSGDQFLTAKTLKAGKVTIYDVNLFTKFFTFLKIGAGKYFSCYEDFNQFIIPQADNSGKFLNFENFMKISDYLPPHEAEFWYLYLKKCNNIQLYNFIPIIKLRHLWAIRNFTPYYSEEGFEQAKQIFNSLDYPDFLFCDLKRLPNRFKSTNEQFDLVDCSNIIECEIYKDLKSLSSDDTEDKLQQKWIDFIQEQLTTIVNPEGKIIVDYRLQLPQGSLCETDLLLNHDAFTTYSIDSNYPGKNSAIVVYQKK